jgi:hypothetical protein
VLDEVAGVANMNAAGVSGVSHDTHQRKNEGVKRKSNSFLILTLLTGSITVCWTPVLVYFTIQLFNLTFSMPEFYQVATMLFSLETVADPIFFTLAMPGWRKSLSKLFKAG